MHKWKYAYRPQRRQPVRRGWWFPLPIAAIIGILILGFRLGSDDNGLSAVNAACPPGEQCAPAGSGLLTQVIGDAQAAPQPTFVSEVAPPTISGQAAAIIEEPCGAFLYGHNRHQRLAPASLTKIATALVAAEGADLSTVVNVQVDGAELAASTSSTIMGLELGQRLSMSDLLYGLLLPSGNDAALAIAEQVGGSVSSFVDLMNRKVEQLRLRNTHFTNPHGLDDPDLYTSAFDIAVLGRELLQQPTLAEIVRTTTYQPAWEGLPLWNVNPLLYSYPGSLGIKIGYTDEAKQTIVAAAEREGRRLIASVLGSIDVYQDASALLDWAFNSIPASCNLSSDVVTPTPKTFVRNGFSGLLSWLLSAAPEVSRNRG